MDERALTQRLRNAQYQRTQSIYNADSIQRGRSWNSLLPVHPPLVSTAGKRLAHKHANEGPASCALRRLKVFGVGTHTVIRTRTRVEREDERMFFSWISKREKEYAPDKTMVAVEAQELRRRASERQRDGRPGYLARRQQVTRKESQ